MSKNLTIILVCLFFSAATFAQSENDSIAYKKAGGEYQFTQQDQILKPAQLKTMMHDYPQAYDYMQKAKTNWDFATIFSYAGGFLIGYQLGALIGGGEFNAAMAGVGGGLVLLAIPLASGYNKNALKAVKIYNSKRRKDTTEKDLISENYTVEFGQTDHGIGICVSF